ncbi:InlB B-repeat-containing protein [Aeromicrobium fastidiosum]|uniref:Leucine-rich repeat protein n=1 Tax=Aeromicrobium fastidiosum TaxID=52699 RepID=A0A641APP3_9ACTN|nr:InlB B-repeat-containing protein [Aeromicrobium fastidiosum]KAA1378215.1 leucine-rich repeat protein [Aeromicrobium fastidiosum]MBP2388976.1 putative repeat protein (TIGR02543 family) [Aeromicrobium fastidiosum]
MPRLLAVVATTAALCGGSLFAAQSASATSHHVVDDGYFYYFDTDNPSLGAELAESQGDTSDLHMLSSVTFGGVEYKVTKVSGLSSWGISDLTLSDNLIEIGDYAFAENPMPTVTIPASVTTIGARAFKNGSRWLTSLTFLGAPPTTFTPAGTMIAGEEGGSLGSPNKLIVTYPWEFDSSTFDGGYTAGTWKGYTTTTTVPVTFDLGGHGSAIEGQDITYGTATTEPEEPTEAGWTFTGWYADADLTTAFDFSDTTTDTAYAGWTQDTVDVPVTPDVPVVPLKPSAPAVLPATTFIVKAPATAKTGKRITVTVRGLAAGETYTLRIAGKDVATGKASKAGTITRTVKIPRSSRSGMHTVKVIGSAINRRGFDTLKITKKK